MQSLLLSSSLRFVGFVGFVPLPLLLSQGRAGAGVRLADAQLRAKINLVTHTRIGDRSPSYSWIASEMTRPSNVRAGGWRLGGPGGCDRTGPKHPGRKLSVNEERASGGARTLPHPDGGQTKRPCLFQRRSISPSLFSCLSALVFLLSSLLSPPLQAYAFASVHLSALFVSRRHLLSLILPVSLWPVTL